MDIQLDIWKYEICVGGDITQINTQDPTEKYTVGTFKDLSPGEMDLPNNPSGHVSKSFVDFVRPPLDAADHDEIENEFSESAEIDETGRVIRTTIKAHALDKFTTEHMASLLDNFNLQKEV